MKRRTVFIFAGPPGSGKGSLSQECVRKLGYRQVSTGNLCRQEIAKGSSLGKDIDFLIKSGKLVPDELITHMVRDWFKGLPDDGVSVILDGYPRTVKQAELFHTLFSTGALPLRVIVVELLLDDAMVMKRLSSRFVCLNKKCQAVYSAIEADMMPEKEGVCDRCGGEIGRRQDDMPEVIQERLKVYHQHAQALMTFYKKMGYRLFRIDADQSITEMLHQLEQATKGLTL